MILESGKLYALLDEHMIENKAITKYYQIDDKWKRTGNFNKTGDLYLRSELILDVKLAEKVESDGRLTGELYKFLVCVPFMVLEIVNENSHEGICRIIQSDAQTNIGYLHYHFMNPNPATHEKFIVFELTADGE